METSTWTQPLWRKSHREHISNPWLSKDYLYWKTQFRVLGAYLWIIGHIRARVLIFFNTVKQIHLIISTYWSWEVQWNKAKPQEKVRAFKLFFMIRLPNKMRRTICKGISGKEEYSEFLRNKWWKILTLEKSVMETSRNLQ